MVYSGNMNNPLPSPKSPHPTLPVSAIVIGIILIAWATWAPGATSDPNIGLAMLGTLGYISTLGGLALLLIQLRGWLKLIPVALAVALIVASFAMAAAAKAKGDVVTQRAAEQRQSAYKALPYAVQAPADLKDDPSTRHRVPGLVKNTVIYQFTDTGKDYLFVQYPAAAADPAVDICTTMPKEAPALAMKSCDPLPDAPGIYLGKLAGGDQVAFRHFSDSTVSLMAAGLTAADAARILGSLQTVDSAQAYKLGIFY